MNALIQDLVNKLVVVLRSESFKTYTLDCSVLVNGTLDISTLTTEPTKFETKLIEAVTESTILQFYQNSTYNLEYFLKIMVYGRDGSDLKLPTDESPVLTELAIIDNSAFTLTPNTTLKAPRRFFRIGVAQVRRMYNYID